MILEPCYSKKIGERLMAARNAGHYTGGEAEERGVFAVTGRGGIVLEGNGVALYWLVDPDDGMILDAKFQVFGHFALIAAADAVCELVIGKNYDQAKRMSGDLIEKKLRDKPDLPAFPDEGLFLLNLILEALEDGAEKCMGIPLASTYSSPIPHSQEGEGNPLWPSLSHEQKLALINEVLDVEVRPYVELDEGGIEVQQLVDQEVTIAYKGSCTSCYSSIGATLSTIQHIVRSKIHPSLTVVPNMDSLQL